MSNEFELPMSRGYEPNQNGHICIMAPCLEMVVDPGASVEGMISDQGMFIRYSLVFSIGDLNSL